MELRKSEYFKLFSEGINIQLSLPYDTKPVCMHKREYLEYYENENPENFSTNG